MSTIHGLIPHQPGYYYITLEEDYVALFETQAQCLFEASEKTRVDVQMRAARINRAVAKAYISSVLEQLSDHLYKATGGEEELWVFLSFPELEQRLHRAYKMRSLKQAMKELTDDGYVLKRPNSNPRFKALEYQMNLARYRQELTALPRKTGKASVPIVHDDSAKVHDDSAKMHDDSAKMHDDSAKMHDDSAKMHGPQCKNAPKNKQIEVTKNKQRERETSATVSSIERATLAFANDPISLIASLFALPLEEAKQVRDMVQQLQEHTPGVTPSKKPSQPEKRTTRRPASRVEVPLTPQGQRILDLYDGFKGRKTSRNTITLAAANGLGEVVNNDERFLEVLQTIASDEFLRRKKVRWDLDFVYRKYDGFLDNVERAHGTPQTFSGEKTNYNDVAGMTDEQRTAYKRQQQAKHTIPGVDRDILMKMKPEERIAYLKQLREQQTVAG